MYFGILKFTKDETPKPGEFKKVKNT